jgi:zinc and cadmium transporter
MRTWGYVAMAIVLDGLAGLAGGMVPERLVRSRQSLLLGFAGGVLVAVVFVDLIPEALAAGNAQVVTGMVLASFAAMAVLEWLNGRRAGGAGSRARAPMLLTSDAVHNVGDGAAIAAAFVASPRLGLATALAVIVHEVPEEIGAYALLRASGMARGPALRRMALVQLTAGVGAALTLVGSTLWGRLSGVVLALAGGTFLYIGATDLLPEALHASERSAQAQALLGFVSGVAVAVLGPLAI